MAGLAPAIHVFNAAGKQDEDARVKPAHDERFVFGTVPVLRSSASQELRQSASKTRVNALMASRPGHGPLRIECAKI
jgi:hypothetical protein